MIIAVLLTAVICIAGTYVLINGNSGGNNNSNNVSIVATGSTTVMPLMTEFQEEFEKHSKVTISISGGGSGVAAPGVRNGSADIGMLSRDPTATERDLRSLIIAKDGVVVIVGANTGVTNLTLEQIAKIYQGEYTNWNQVGGTDQAIRPVIREDGSGTRDCIDTAMKTVAGFNTNNYNNYPSQSSTGSMISSVTGTQGSIGYVNLGAIKDLGSATPLTVNGVQATPENVINGSYASLSRNLVLLTGNNPSTATQSFLNWIMSAQGQAIVEAEGFVPLPKTDRP
ncbi:MAG: phosphate ABC transporter substrate-binding protein [Candidatus Methanoplasma sp.]|jgi:phosphate transport system substrate-binding protein|nr:phosphate ABC transporter substrate-binding protein [Candidatus Methanoplasma sp.]